MTEPQSLVAPPPGHSAQAPAPSVESPPPSAASPARPSAGSGGTTGFAGGAQGWLDGLGGLRDVVRQELVARQIRAHLPVRPAKHGRLRILDVGCGQGTQALWLAREGHRVTGMDTDPRMLDALRSALAQEESGVRSRVELLAGDGRDAGRHFRPGSFDVVLCHGVLMYLDQPDPLLVSLVRVLAPGGLLSLLVRNGDALAMRPGLAGDWSAALAAFDTDRYINRLGLTSRGDHRVELTKTLGEMGVQVGQWYGVRVFTDLTPTAADQAMDQAQLEHLLAVEEEAGRRDPYRGVAALLHLCGVRG